MKFTNKADFDENFGKEHWLESYQMAEIARTKFKEIKQDVLGSQVVDDNKKKIMEDLVKLTKKSQSSSWKPLSEKDPQA